MNDFTEIFIKKLFDSLDPVPADCSREQYYFAFLLCKNLTDLCETGCAMLNSLESRGHSTQNFPDRHTIQLCRNLLHKYYSESMFVDHPDLGTVPNWKVIDTFPKDRKEVAFKIYRSIQNNLSKDENKICDAIKSRDKTYFVNNFEKIFEDMPFQESLSKFKSFLSSSSVNKHDQDYLFDFFETVCEMFIYEKENMEELKNFSK